MYKEGISLPWRNHSLKGKDFLSRCSSLAQSSQHSKDSGIPKLVPNSFDIHENFERVPWSIVPFFSAVRLSWTSFLFKRNTSQPCSKHQKFQFSTNQKRLEHSERSWFQSFCIFYLEKYFGVSPWIRLTTWVYICVKHSVAFHFLKQNPSAFALVQQRGSSLILNASEIRAFEMYSINCVHIEQETMCSQRIENSEKWNIL